MDTAGLSRSLFLRFFFLMDSFRCRQGKPPGKGWLEYRPSVPVLAARQHHRGVCRALWPRLHLTPDKPQSVRAPEVSLRLGAVGGERLPEGTRRLNH